MKKQALLFFSLVYVLQTSAQRDGAQALSLQQAIDYALSSKIEAKNAQLDIEKAKARNWEITTTGLPTISGSVDYKYFFKRPTSPAFEQILNDPNSVTNQVYGVLAQNSPAIASILQNAAAQSSTPISFVLPHDLQAGVQLSQLIFDGRYILGLKAAKELMKTAVLSKDLSDQDIRYNVKKAYYQALAAQEAKAYLNETYTVVSKLVYDTREVYKAGFAEELDVNRLELIQSNLEGQIQTQNQLAVIANTNLKFQIGMDVKTPLILTDKLDVLRNGASANEGNLDITQRSEYELLKTAQVLGDLDAKQRASGYYPSIFGFVNYAGQSQVTNFKEIFQKNSLGKNNWFQTGVVGISMKVPIFDSGLKNAQVKQARLDLQKTKNQFENFQQAAELQTIVSNTNFKAALIDEQIAKRSLALSEKIYTKSRIKFKEGVGSSFELVQAEQDFIQSQLKRIQSTLGVLTNRADLDKALGIK